MDVSGNELLGLGSKQVEESSSRHISNGFYRETEMCESNKDSFYKGFRWFL